ncbi:pectinesterase/pectinesterase inhibitor PPE8B, partial [Trifolium medium]|nr:pectinesterase/pectinesterase inhibitor PPE8B [Trifolium medium]
MNESTGFSFQFCNISADTDLQPTTQTYLGRPWGAYSRTIFMQSYLSNAISPKGWIPWNTSNLHLDTLTYGEFKNFGQGAKVADR